MFEDDPKPDTRSDVFSLAATVYTLVAGRTPFEIPGRPNGSLDLMGRIERGTITPIDRADVPRSLVAVLAKGMAKRRDDRFPSAIEFARALQRIELELGYAATSIEVPNLTSSPEAPADDDGADATRARSVRTVEAQAQRSEPIAPAPGTPALDEERTRARTPQQIAAQPPLAGDVAAAPAEPIDDGTVVRTRAGSAGIAASPAEAPDATIVRPRRVASASAAPPALTPPQAEGAREADDHTAPRRSRLGLIVGVAAALVVAAVIGVTIAMSGSVAPPAAETGPTSPGEDAVIAATVPAPTVEPGVTSADGTSVAFGVSHDDAEDGDRYRWKRADGSGQTEVTEGPTITVAGSAAGAVCIDVQVQRGSKTSEPVRGCSG
jgi:hypothetical protein